MPAGEPGLRVVVSDDGTLACVIEPAQVVLVTLPSLEREGEIGIADGAQVALVGDPARVMVLEKTGTLHVVDPRGADGPEKVGELQVDAGSRIRATAGSHALIATPAGAAIASLGDQPRLSRLPARVMITGAGRSSSDHFMVAVQGALEEWSAEQRAPLRRFRLDKPVAARHLGASARHIWFVPEAAPNEIIVVPLAGATPPARLELPEPARAAVADPSGAHVAIVGAETGAVFVIAIGERTTTRVQTGRADDVAWRGAGTLLCVGGTTLELVELAVGATGHDARAAQRGDGDGEDEQVAGGEPEPAPRREAEPASERESVEDRQLTASERLTAWKQRVQTEKAAEVRDDMPPSESAAVRARALATRDELHEWRDVIAAWTARTLSGARGDTPLIAAGPLHDVGLRLALSEDEQRVLWLVYGARLLGHDGVAPVDIARMAPRRWQDALGRTRLADCGAFRWRRNRIGLSPEIQAVLDETAPRTGSIVTSPLTIDRQVAILAPSTLELAAVGAWAGARLGSLLVPNPRGRLRPDRFLLEARARGLVPLVPWATPVPKEPAAVLVDDATVAAGLGLTIALTWPA